MNIRVNPRLSLGYSPWCPQIIYVLLSTFQRFKGSGLTLLSFDRRPAVSGLEPKGHWCGDLWLLLKSIYMWVCYLYCGFIPIRTPHVHVALLCGRKSWLRIHSAVIHFRIIQLCRVIIQCRRLAKSTHAHAIETNRCLYMIRTLSIVA